MFQHASSQPVRNRRKVSTLQYKVLCTILASCYCVLPPSVFIFICASIGWMILAATVDSRTHSADSGLRGHVVSTWGAPHVQKSPSAGYDETVSQLVESVEDGKKIVRR